MSQPKYIVLALASLSLGSALLLGCSASSGSTLSDLPAAATFPVASNQNTQGSNGWDFREETIYFVVTDRFVDGDPGNNNIYGDEYRPGQLTFYQGGDFKGLIANLDYIKEMGFSAIWITPPV